MSQASSLKRESIAIQGHFHFPYDFQASQYPGLGIFYLREIALPNSSCGL